MDPSSGELLGTLTSESSAFVPGSGEDVAVSTKSSSSPTMTSSSPPPLIALDSAVLGDGEARDPVERSVATLSSSNANQLEFVNREPLQLEQ